MSDLRNTLIEELKDIYDAEKQLTKALPKLAKAAGHDELKSAFEDHLEETEDHVRRLEQVFEILGEQPKAKKCKAMHGLIEEGNELIKEEEGDAALICAAQKVEHYEIAAYGSLRTWAEMLGENDVAKLLEGTLQQEKQADEKLSDIAERAVNPEEGREEGAPERKRSGAHGKQMGRRRSYAM